MSPISENYIKSIVVKVAIVLQLEEWHYVKNAFESIAQNYFGVLVPLTLFGKHNGEEVSIPLVLKLAPTDERYRVSGALTLFFAKEIYVYSTVLNKYIELQKNMLKTDYKIPRCYYLCDDYCKEVLVLQDMTAEGYKPYTSSSFLNIEHITVSLKSLAKFHALSFVMQAECKNLYVDAMKKCIPLTYDTNKRFMDIMRDRISKSLMIFKNTTYVPLLEYLLQNCDKLIELSANSVQATCICHGDIWKENILFKYMEEKPVSACLIDYQTARMCSPAFDMLYLIISSTDTSLRQKYYHKLLDTYYESFDETLIEAGLNSENVYSREAFNSDLKVVGPACFIVANCALWLSNGLQDEGHVRSKVICTTKEQKFLAANRYKTVIKGIIDDFTDYQYISSYEDL